MERARRGRAGGWLGDGKGWEGEGGGWGRGGPRGGERGGWEAGRRGAGWGGGGGGGGVVGGAMERGGTGSAGRWLRDGKGCDGECGSLAARWKGVRRGVRVV